MTGTKLRARKIGHETRGYFLLLSIPSIPPLFLSLLPPSSSSSSSPLPFETTLRFNSRGIDIKQSTLWFGSIEFVAFFSPPLPPPSPFLQRDKEVRQQFYGFIFLATDTSNSRRSMKMRLLNAT